MSGYIILDTIIIDYELLKNLENGKDDQNCDINRDTPDNVRPIFGEHERTISTPGQGLQIIRKSDEPDITINKHSELSFGSELRISTPKGSWKGMEGCRQSSFNFCGNKPYGNRFNA